VANLEIVRTDRRRLGIGRLYSERRFGRLLLRSDIKEEMIDTTRTRVSGAEIEALVSKTAF
jgi:hypothetical protein